jgi:hypothetical protein
MASRLERAAEHRLARGPGHHEARLAEVVVEGALGERRDGGRRGIVHAAPLPLGARRAAPEAWRPAARSAKMAR